MTTSEPRTSESTTSSKGATATMSDMVDERPLRSEQALSDRVRMVQVKRKRARHRTTVIVLRLVVLVVFLGLWEIASGRWLDGFFISKPSLIAEEWWTWVVDGTLMYHAQSTLATAGLGFLIGSVAAIIVGYVLGGSPRLAEVFEPFITATYSLPKIALVPLLVMWVGVGGPLQITIAALVTFFLMFYNTFFGVRDVSRTLVDSVRILGANRLTLAMRVRLPSALVWVIAGMKLSVPQALIAAVVGEILASNRGLGYLVASNAGQFNTAGTFAALFTLLLVGLLVDRLVTWVSQRATAWRLDATG
jgi:NitT/TauT family transport system permease protein